MLTRATGQLLLPLKNNGHMGGDTRPIRRAPAAAVTGLINAKPFKPSTAPIGRVRTRAGWRTWEAEGNKEVKRHVF